MSILFIIVSHWLEKIAAWVAHDMLKDIFQFDKFINHLFKTRPNLFVTDVAAWFASVLVSEQVESPGHQRKTPNVDVPVVE